MLNMIAVSRASPVTRPTIPPEIGPSASHARMISRGPRRRNKGHPSSLSGGGGNAPRHASAIRRFILWNSASAAALVATSITGAWEGEALSASPVRRIPGTSEMGAAIYRTLGRSTELGAVLEPGLARTEAGERPPAGAMVGSGGKRGNARRNQGGPASPMGCQRCRYGCAVVRRGSRHLTADRPPPSRAGKQGRSRGYPRAAGRCQG